MYDYGHIPQYTIYPSMSTLLVNKKIQTEEKIHILNLFNDTLFMSTWVHPRFTSGICAAHLFSFLCCIVIFCYICLHRGSYVPSVSSGLSILVCSKQFTLMFIFYSINNYCVSKWKTMHF